MDQQVSGTSRDLGRPQGIALDGERLPLSPLWGAVPFTLLMAVIFVGCLLEGNSGTGATITGGILLVMFALHGPYLLVALFRFRFNVALYARGFTVRRGSTVQAIAYDELETLNLVERALLRNGVHLGWLRTVVARSQGVKAGFSVFAPEGQRDPGAKLIGRLFAEAEEAVRKRIEAGGMLHGDGWTLDAKGLWPHGEPVVALSELRAAGNSQGHVSLWRGTEEKPFLSVLEGGPNAHLLLALARRHLSAPGSTVGSRVEADVSPLGRVVYAKSRDPFGAGCLGLVGLFSLCFGTMFSFGDSGSRPVAPFLLAVGVLCGFIGAQIFASHIQCHERGLVRRTLFGSRTLLYTDIESFCFGTSREYEKGLYAHTNIWLFISPREGLPISFNTEAHGNDADLELLRDNLARIVANRLYQQLRAGGDPVRWGGGNVRLGHGALVFHADGQQPPRSLAYSADLRFSIEDGNCSLFVRGEPKPVLTLLCAEANFYPGLLVFHRLCSDAASRGNAQWG
jgi:hypothetical protein